MSTLSTGLTKEQLASKSPAELIAIINGLESKKEAIAGEMTVKIGKRTFTLRVSTKGAVSVYGFGRFPVTLYREQWEFMFQIVDHVKAFIASNVDKLTTKAE